MPTKNLYYGIKRSKSIQKCYRDKQLFGCYRSAGNQILKYPSIYQTIIISIYSSTYKTIIWSIYLSVHPNIYYLPACLSVQVYTTLSMEKSTILSWISNHPFIYLNTFINIILHSWIYVGPTVAACTSLYIYLSTYLLIQLCIRPSMHWWMNEWVIQSIGQFIYLLPLFPFIYLCYYPFIHLPTYLLYICMSACLSIFVSARLHLPKFLNFQTFILVYVSIYLYAIFSI